MSARRLRVELAPSALLAMVLAGSHAAAALCVLAAVPGLTGVLLAALLGLLGVASAWSRALLRSRASVRALELAGDELTLELASGATIAARAAPRRYVSGFMVALPLAGAEGSGRRTLLITRDMTDREAFRRLRIWALWGRLPRPVASPQLRG